MSRISIYFAGELRCRVLAHSSPTQIGMSRHSLCGDLHFIPQNELKGVSL
jgi:hypothetical protein